MHDTRLRQHSGVVIEYLCYAVLALALVIPRNVFFPFIFGKAFFFELAVELVFVLWLAHAFFVERRRPFLTHFHLLLVAFMVWLGATGLFGVNPYKSILGGYERMDGLVNLAHWLLWFFVVADVFRDPLRRLRMAHAFVALGVIESLHVIGQRLGVMQMFAGASPLPFGALGNPLYLSAFIAFGWFLSLTLMWRHRRETRAVIYFVSSLVMSAALVIPRSRGVIIALALASILWLAAMCWIENKKRFALILVGLFAVVIAFGAVFVSQGGLWNLARDESSYNRLVLWDLAARVTREYPLGVGLGNFNVELDRHFDPRVYHLPGSETWFDNPHNALLYYGVSAGPIGAAFYATLFAVLLGMAARRVICHARDAPYDVALAAGLLAYFIQSLTSIENPGVNFLFFGAMGLVVAGRGVEERDMRNAPSLFNAAAIAILAVVAFLLLVPLHAQGWRTGRDVIRYRLSFMNPDISAKVASDALKNAVFGKYDVYDAIGSGFLEYLTILQNSTTTFMQLNLTPVERMADAVARHMRDSLRDSASLARHAIMAGISDLKMYEITAKERYLERAEKFLLAARAISPARPQITANLAGLALSRKDVEGALNEYDLLIKQAPWVAESHMAKAEVLLRADKRDEARRALEQGIESINKSSMSVVFTAPAAEKLQRAFTVFDTRPAP